MKHSCQYFFNLLIFLAIGFLLLSCAGNTFSNLASQKEIKTDPVDVGLNWPIAGVEEVLAKAQPGQVERVSSDEETGSLWLEIEKEYYSATGRVCRVYKISTIDQDFLACQKTSGRWMPVRKLN